MTTTDTTTAERVRWMPRRPGWHPSRDLPAGFVFVGRTRRKRSRWDTKFDWQLHGRAEAVRRHREWLLSRPDLVDLVRAELAGRALACTCPLDVPCHADTLLEVANAPHEDDATEIITTEESE